MERLHLEGLVFDGGVGGFTPYTLADLSGWGVGGAGVRRQRDYRPGAHGAFSAPGYLTERAVAWSGLILTDTQEEQEHAIRRLSGVLADGGTGRLSDGTLWCDVQLEDMPAARVLVPGTIAEYAVSLIAPDPMLYGESHDFAAGVEAYHFGNMPASPLLLIGAGSGGYTVTGPGGRVVTVATAPAGAHTIDLADGGLYSGGVRQANAISVYQPWKVGPGIPGVTATISGARSLVQRVTDTSA